MKLQICNKGHEEVCYAGPVCPMCELKTKVLGVLECGSSKDQEKPTKDFKSVPESALESLRH